MGFYVVVVVWCANNLCRQLITTMMTMRALITPQPYNIKLGTVLLTRPIRKSINSSILLYNLLPIKKKRVTLQLRISHYTSRRKATQHDTPDTAAVQQPFITFVTICHCICYRGIYYS